MIKPYRIVIASIKGGTGKTTTAVSLAAMLASYSPTLLVDFDPQGQCATHFGRKQSPGVYDWLMNNATLPECLYIGRPDTLRILPGDTSSKDVAYKFVTQSGAFPLASKLMEIEGFAFQVYDTAAGGFLQEAALYVADHVVVPFRTEGASLASLKNVLDVIHASGGSVPITLLPVGYMRQYTIHRSNLEAVVTALGERYHVSEESAVPHRVGVLEAFSEGKTIWEYKEPSVQPVRAAYHHLTAHLLHDAGYVQNQENLENTYGAPSQS